MATATVQPEKILKDLAKLWVDLAKEDQQKGSAGVLRACAMTLIAAVEEAEDAQSAGETIANIVHQHPSRVIVLRVLPNHEDGLDARVFAQCWMPFGRRQQICCEEIEINASQSRVDDLPNLMLALIAPDLPVVLWCRSERLARDARFQKLYDLAGKVIVDSATFEDPASALNYLRQLTAKGVNVADLTWTRLTPLREAVAQIFDSEGARAHLKSIEKIRIEYVGPEAIDAETQPLCLRYLTAWFRNTLHVPVELQRQQPGPAYDVSAIVVEGPGFLASIEQRDSHADIHVNQITRRVSFPELSDCDLLREELGIPGLDPVFRGCLQ